MEFLTSLLAAAPIAWTVILLSPLWGQTRLRNTLPLIGAAVLLLFSSTMSAQCTARNTAIDEVESRIFPTPSTAIAVYDMRRQEWLQFSSAAGSANTSDVRLLSGTRSAPTTGRAPGLAAPEAERQYGVQLKGDAQDIKRLERAIEVLATSRVGQAVLGDVLQRQDVVITLSDDVGLELPNGKVLTTGGTAVTEGKHVTISRGAYGYKAPEILAAMIGHELTHVAQNVVAGTAWWQWPWTTVDREATAHIVQAMVWAETRGLMRDWEQDRNLQNALDRDRLHQAIQTNPAYPWWLAPKLSC